jgi:hypothetical protein
VYVQSTSVVTAWYALPLVPLVHASTFLHLVMPKDLKNFPTAPVYKCLQCPCDSRFTSQGSPMQNNRLYSTSKNAELCYNISNTEYHNAQSKKT